jgi:hypothetical protein
MRHSLLAFAVTLALSVPAFAAPEIGKPAPDFNVKDARGVAISPAGFKDRILVIEWVNFGCPFVKKHYGAKNMQSLQEAAAKDDVVWISVFSSAEGKEGYIASGEEALKEMEAQGGKPTHIVLDPNGDLGRAYGAKTTPHMFVIAKDGTLAYMGAIDDKPTPNPDDVTGAKNYVVEALNAVKAGKTPEVASTQAYGCGVKY